MASIPTGSWFAAVCALGIFAAGCTTSTPAPVSDLTVQPKPVPGAKPPASARPAPLPADARPAFYTVRSGDTLYSIALDHGLDYRELAIWNGIPSPGAIRAGQQLRMTPPGQAATTATTTTTTAPFRTAPDVEGRPIGGASPPATGPGQAAGASAQAAGGIKTQPQALKVPYSDQAYAQLASIRPASPQAKPEAYRNDPAVSIRKRGGRLAVQLAGERQNRQ
jgi:lipoprotein NlpD